MKPSLISIETVYLPAIMAGAEMPWKDLLIFGYPLDAEILGIRAALGKTATRLRIHGRGDLTTYDALNFLRVDRRHGNGRKQPLCIGMKRSAEKLLRLGKLRLTPEIHDQDRMRDVPHD